MRSQSEGPGVAQQHEAKAPNQYSMKGPQASSPWLFLSMEWWEEAPCTMLGLQNHSFLSYHGQVWACETVSGALTDNNPCLPEGSLTPLPARTGSRVIKDRK